MATNLFKRLWIPNADGSNSTTPCTNTNTGFFHTYLGDDSTGNGTREFPFKSYGRTALKSGITYINFRGVINEYFNQSKPIIGDDINQTLITANFLPAVTDIKSLTTDKLSLSTSYAVIQNVISMNDLVAYSRNGGAFNNIIAKGLCNLGGDNRPPVTFITSKYVILASGKYINCLFSNRCNITGYNATQFTCFTTNCVFQLNGVNIVHPSYGNDSLLNMILVKSSLLSAGITQANIDLLFPKDSFGNETCRIVRQQKDGGTSPNIFNKYSETLTGALTSAITANQAKTSIQLSVTDSSKFATTGDIFVPNTAGDGYEVFTYTSVTINSGVLITFNGSNYTFKVAHNNGTSCIRYGDVSDFTLNSNPLNEVIHASDIGGCVGYHSTAISANNWGSIINVNADGSDDVVAGQLLQSDFTFSHASGQTWNRIQSAIEKIEKPGKFKGLNCDTLDGTPWGDYFGKKQNLVSDVSLNPTDALEPNTRYKVANTADHTNYAIVIYKGVQYPPDFFFVTDATNLTFDLLNAGSGSVVRKVFAAPLESGEIIPFDDYTTPSAFPRFSAPFMGDVLMLFHKIGANINQPVLFSEVTNDKIAYYANWAVTNADQEFVTLAADTVNYYYKIPILTYYKKELNAHFDANYDQ